MSVCERRKGQSSSTAELLLPYGAFQMYMKGHNTGAQSCGVDNRAWCGTRLLLANPDSSAGFAAVRNVHISKSFVFQVIEVLAIIFQACKANTSRLPCLPFSFTVCTLESSWE